MLRRALLFLLLTSLLDAGASLLPDPSRNAALPGLKVAGWILALVGLAEFCQYLLLDLALVAWLRRPPPPRILRDFATLVMALTAFFVALHDDVGGGEASRVDRRRWRIGWGRRGVHPREERLFETALGLGHQVLARRPHGPHGQRSQGQRDHDADREREAGAQAHSALGGRAV